MADKVRLSDKKFKEVYNFLNQYVDKDAANAFDKAYNEGREIEWLNKRWNVLEGYTPWVNTYSSIEDLTASPDKQLEQIYNKNPDYNKISQARMKNILDNNDVTPEQLKAYYDYRNAQAAEVAKDKEAKLNESSDTYGQIERSKDDSYYNSLLANEYAREAHIKDDPQMAAYHEVVGKVAGASDFAPPPLSFLGPGLRTVQKYYAGKDVLTPGTLADFGGAFIPDVAEKPARFIYNSAKEAVERIAPKVGDSKIMKAIEARVNKADVKKVQDIAKSDMNVMHTNLSELSDKELLDLYDKADNPRIKSKIEEYFRARNDVRHAQQLKESPFVQSNTEAIELADKNLHKSLDDFRTAEFDFIKTSSKELPTTELKAGINKAEPFADNSLNTYYKDVPLSTLSEYEANKVTPNKTASALYNAMSYGGRKAARTAIGGRVGQWNTFNPEPADKSEQLVKDVINTYSKEWSPTEPPANYHTNPLIRDAYDKWYEDISNRPFFEVEWTTPKTYRMLKGNK